MDPERQPLLNPNPNYVQNADVRCRRYRALTTEEVISTHQEVAWRRARFLIVLMFWGVMALVLSCAAAVLLQAPRCPAPAPAVAPVHLNFAPLVAQTERGQLTWMF